MNLHPVSSPLKLGCVIITDFIDVKKDKFVEEEKMFCLTYTLGFHNIGKENQHILNMTRKEIL